MKRLNPEANKDLTVKAIILSGDQVAFKAIEPCIVLLPNIKIQNIQGKPEPLVFHICKPAKLVTALSDSNVQAEYEIIDIWKKTCGILFTHTADSMFCSTCMKEYDGSLYKKLAVVMAAGKLKL